MSGCFRLHQHLPYREDQDQAVQYPDYGTKLLKWPNFRFRRSDIYSRVFLMRLQSDCVQDGHLQQPELIIYSFYVTSLSGSVKVKIQPCGTLSVRLSFPLCASIIEWQSASPRPRLR